MMLSFFSVPLSLTLQLSDPVENEAAQKKTDKKEETVSRTAVYYAL